MDKRAIWKWLFLVLFIVSSLAIMSRGINLGLDLQGGSSFVVQIQEDRLAQNLRDENPDKAAEWIASELPSAVKKAQTRALEVIRGRIDSLGIAEPDIYAERENRIVIQLPGISAETRHEAERQIQEVGFLSFHLVHKDNEKLVEALWENGWAPEGYKIERLSDERRRREGNFYVRLQGKEAVKLSAKELETFHAPSGYNFMLQRRDIGGREAYIPCFVHWRSELTGDFLQSARDEPGGFGEPLVLLRFDGQGKRKFRQITGDYAPRGRKNLDSDRGRQLAIVLDNILYSAPELRTPIYDGEAQIEGIPSLEEARHLANVLQAGSLPAPVEIVEKHEVDPSLGQDSIRSGIKAVLFGGVCVFVFMVAYYLLSGFVADIALLLDLALMPLGMVLAAGFLGIFASGKFGISAIALPVLTMPGIAGIVLTLGMAVDANVLIYERIREESRLGKTIKAAVAAGYDRAFLAIVDSNLTTVLSAIILFIVGSGPVRGFAVTLCGGIIVSMFTAIVVTRMIFDLLVSKFRVTQLKMFQLIRETSFDFIGKGVYAGALSIAVILISWALLVVNYQKGIGRVLGVDFTGGSSVTFGVDDENKKPSVSDVRDALAQAGVQEATIQYKRPLEQGGAGNLVIRSGVGVVNGVKPGDLIRQTIVGKYGNAGLSQERIEIEEVGPQVGYELRKRAMWALFFSIVGMIIYISLRFEFSFAIGAIVALIHDVLVAAGVYCLFGRQLSLTIIAALLTIIGYSVNDTIVIFDRIRENLRNSELRRKMTFKEICNLSVNQTFGRTLLTSLTVLISIGMLLFFGGGAVNDFALCMFIGCIAGVYSTVYVATPVVMLWYRGGRMPAAKTA